MYFKNWEVYKKISESQPKPGVTIKAWVASSCCWICCWRWWCGGVGDGDSCSPMTLLENTPTINHNHERHSGKHREQTGSHTCIICSMSSRCTTIIIRTLRGKFPMWMLINSIVKRSFSQRCFFNVAPSLSFIIIFFLLSAVVSQVFLNSIVHFTILFWSFFFFNFTIEVFSLFPLFQ